MKRRTGTGLLLALTDSVFEIGSSTKVFTAALLADMVDAGEVRLTDPVGTHLPSTVRMPRPNGREITLIDLATQSSGVWASSSQNQM